MFLVSRINVLLEISSNPVRFFRSEDAGVPGPGLVMQHAILLVCFTSSFASFGKVLV